jgi:hypothetical protein
MTLLALPCLAAAACSSRGQADGESEWFSKPVNFFATPDWLKDSGPRGLTLSPNVAAEDLMSADGGCAGMNAPPLSADASGDQPVSAAPTPSVPTGGVALGMSECEVARRAGRPDRLEFGSNERGERSLVMTYLGGYRPGIYRFSAGALASIERGPEPPPAPKPVRKPPPKVAATPRAAPAAAPAPQARRPAQQQPAAASPWPGQAQSPGAAPWPSATR